MALIDLTTNLATWNFSPSSPAAVTPTPVDFFNDIQSGAKGFTLNMTNTRYIGANEITNTYSYPSTVHGNRLMKPGNSRTISNIFGTPNNWFNDRFSGAKGFTLNMTNTQFLGADEIANTYVYPETVHGNRLMKPGNSRTISSIFGTPNNWFNDIQSGAKGFTLNMFPKNGSKKESQFLGIDGLSYSNYEKRIISNYNSTGPTGWTPGDTSMLNQLGNGSTNLIRSYDGKITNTYNWYLPTTAFDTGVKFPHTGFHSGNRYSDMARLPFGFLAATYNTNSPIDDAYKKFNLQDESYNTTYIQHPLVVRGLQRKDSKTPQRWGLGLNFDDGLIRGGATTVAERAAHDSIRISKWMASPKGLLWIVKQAGLGLSNPKVETVGGPLTRFNRIHTGRVTSLLSVAGTAFGLHFTRHGIPFVNEIGDYENVMRRNNLLFDTGYNNANRLVSMRNTMMGNDITVLGKTFPSLLVGMPIPEISGLAGPQSVYGIGVTNIKRKVDSRTDAKVNANEKYKFKSFYSITSQYAPAIVGNRLNPSDDVTSIGTSKAVDEQGSDGSRDIRAGIDIANLTPDVKSLRTRINDTFKTDSTPGSKTKSDDREDVDISTNVTRKSSYPDILDNPINQYFTVAYNVIPKSTDITSINDFRFSISTENANLNSVKSILGDTTANLKDYYTNHNLENKKGFGALGQVSKTNDVQGSGSFIVSKEDVRKNEFNSLSNTNFRGDKITAINVVNTKVNKTYPTDVRDLINFYFEDGTQGLNVMPFRCTMTGFSDSFGPSWNKIDIMGRPDGAYMYESFERTISFSFIVAALSRPEMIPMWRKLNRLASYTMPNYDSAAGTRPSGPFMRISIGNLFQRTPGFLTSLTYSVPDEASWDIAEDFEANSNPLPKQLPMAVEVSATFTIVADYRPQLGGRVYSLQALNGKVGDVGDWISDSKPVAVMNN